MKTTIYQGFSRIVFDIVTIIEYRENNELLKTEIIRLSNYTFKDEEQTMNVIEEIAQDEFLKAEFED